MGDESLAEVTEQPGKGGGPEAAFIVQFESQGGSLKLKLSGCTRVSPGVMQELFLSMGTPLSLALREPHILSDSIEKGPDWRKSVFGKSATCQS